MRALLDTHVFLWWINDDSRLISHVRNIIADRDNELFLSAASCWEIAIKAHLGRISFPRKPDTFIADQMSSNAIQSLPVQASHALHTFNLPHLHKDPFDRMIASQAQLEGLPVITSDPLIARYKIKIIWKRK